MWLSLISAAFAADFAGTWTDGTLSLTLQKGAMGYRGEAVLSGVTWQVQGVALGESFQGIAAAGFEQTTFQMIPQGDALVVTLEDGTTYVLRSRAGAQAEAAGALAKGAHGTLTAADVAAFHEALLFSLDYAGVTDARTQLKPEEVRSALIKAFPTLSADEQTAVANADVLWASAQSRWLYMSVSEQQAFVREVLDLAYGEQSQRVGGSSSTGYAGSIPDVDSMSYPGSDCWASAGCAGYEPGSDTYTYETYDYSTGSYYPD